MFGVPFLQAGSSWLLLTVESVPCAWAWTGGLSRFPGWGSLRLMFWWVELNFFSLECNEVFIGEFWGVYGFGMALDSPSCNDQGCVPVFWRISVVYLALELVGSWVELGFRISMETFA